MPGNFTSPAHSYLMPGNSLSFISGVDIRLLNSTHSLSLVCLGQQAFSYHKGKALCSIASHPLNHCLPTDEDVTPKTNSLVLDWVVGAHSIEELSYCYQ